jgi:hypothetical protein
MALSSKPVGSIQETTKSLVKIASATAEQREIGDVRGKSMTLDHLASRPARMGTAQRPR